MSLVSGQYVSRFMGKLQQLEETWVMLNGFKTNICLLKSSQYLILEAPNPSEEMIKNLKSLNADIKKRRQDIQTSLKGIAKDARKSNCLLRDTEFEILKFQYKGLSIKFKNATEDYQSSQLYFQDRIAKRRELQLSNLDITDKEEVFEKRDPTFCGKIIRDTLIEKALFEDVITRNNDIAQIEKSVLIIHEIFLELNMHVESQGESLDLIEAHKEKSQQLTSNGLIDLKVFERNNKLEETQQITTNKILFQLKKGKSKIICQHGIVKNKIICQLGIAKSKIICQLGIAKSKIICQLGIAKSKIICRLS